MAAPGINDSVIDGRTGWTIDREREFGQVLTDALTELADENRARVMAADCQAWARCFSWDRSAELLAGVVLAQISRRGGSGRSADRRYARGDISTVATFPSAYSTKVGRHLRTTDEIVERNGTTSLLLGGCDEFDAVAVLRRLGISVADVRLAERTDLLAGPDATQRLVWQPRTVASVR
jgi:hypothetical protein